MRCDSPECRGIPRTSASSAQPNCLRPRPAESWRAWPARQLRGMDSWWSIRFECLFGGWPELYRITSGRSIARAGGLTARQLLPFAHREGLGITLIVGILDFRTQLSRLMRHECEAKARILADSEIHVGRHDRLAG